jgi:hypothetical protein
VTAYEVADGTQIHHDGQVHPGGSTVDVDPAAARLWLAFGWVVEAEPAAKRRKPGEPTT